MLPEKRAHFVEPKLVASVRFGELTSEGCVRHPSFMKLVDDIDPRDCTWEAAFGGTGNTPSNTEQTPMPLEEAQPPSVSNDGKSREVTITHPDKVFWPKEGYTKADLVDYYRKIARWMLPYLKDRPVMIVRYPDGIEGKSFYQKDAPAFAPEWIRTVTIYSHDSQRDINYFIIENEDALAYLANLATIPIHIWSSRIGSVENPDWLLFDLDPKGSTTEKAVHTARETVKLLDEIGLKSAIKTSGQMGIHVMVGAEARLHLSAGARFRGDRRAAGGGEDSGRSAPSSATRRCATARSTSTTCSSAMAKLSRRPTRCGRIPARRSRRRCASRN